MKKILLGFAIAPIIWALLVIPASEFVYGLLVPEHRYWSLHLLWAVDWPLLGMSYFLMLVVFAPYSILCRALGRNSIWVYVLGGLVLGFVCPVYLFFLNDLLFGSGSGAALRGGPWLVIPEAWHFQSGAALASSVSLATFWIIAIRNNEWLQTQPNSALNRTRKNSAPVS
jgi:hypothetical protein